MSNSSDKAMLLYGAKVLLNSMKELNRYQATLTCIFMTNKERLQLLDLQVKKNIQEATELCQMLESQGSKHLS